MRVGVEVGGTFTDLVAIEGGTIRIAKVPSTPARPDEGALAAIRAAEIALSRVDDLVHGSTVATNAILERKGAAVAFLTTRGFRDVLLLQRHNRRQIYDLAYAKPVPVVARRDSFEVDERIGPDGGMLKPLDVSAAIADLETPIRAGGYQAIAICLLNAYANPAHEIALAAALHEAFPDITVTCSSDVTREFREYERASTTTLAAYVQPVIDRYLSRFESDLSAGGFTGRFSVMQSNGGRLPAVGMAKNAITSLFSGPAAGVMGAVRQAGLSDFQNLITLDMGGTSTDVCLIADGKPDIAGETEVDGLPIRTPVLDIATVGAGGGSIVWRDDGGMLRVGPRSAGAEPGPACYGRGGTAPTITDAHLIRGTMRAEAFLGGRMSIDAGAARAAFAELARTFEMDLATIADSAVRVADANIVRAIQLVSTERGRDPRDYALVPFGGAGPLHAARIAEELRIDTICVPPNAGVLSAYGLLAADFVQYETRTRRVPVEDGVAAVMRETFAEMQATASAAFTGLGIGAPSGFTYTLDMRYVGQAFEVPVEIEPDAIAALTTEHLQRLFHDAHTRVFEFGGAGMQRAEIVSFRLGASVPPEVLPALAEDEGADERTGETIVFDGGAERPCKLFSRRALATAGAAAGPALIEDATSTIYIPQGWRGRVDASDNLIITKTEQRR